MRFLLDTCLISEVVARAPHPGVIAWLRSVEESRTFLSAITVGEIARGVELLPDGKRRRRLAEWLEEDLLPRFADRVIPLDARAMLRWAALTVSVRARGRTLPVLDSLIAATCLASGCTLVTRNGSDFNETGVPIFDPWNGKSPPPL